MPSTTTERKSMVKEPKCLCIAEKGIRTDIDFANCMSALMTDLIEGSIASGVGNAVCNAGGKLLKVVELKLKYGKASEEGGRVLQLV